MEAYRARISEFASQTSVHGVQQLARKRGGLGRKLVWIVLFLVMNAVFIALTAGIFQRYFSYNAEVAVNVKFEKKTKFPSVTICNLNPVRKAALLQYRKEDAAVKGLIGTLNEIHETLSKNPFAHGEFVEFMKHGCNDQHGGRGPPPGPHRPPPPRNPFLPQSPHQRFPDPWFSDHDPREKPPPRKPADDQSSTNPWEEAEPMREKMSNWQSRLAFLWSRRYSGSYWWDSSSRDSREEGFGRFPPCLLHQFVHEVLDNPEAMGNPGSEPGNNQQIEALMKNLTTERNITLPENFTENYLRFQEMRAFTVLKTKFMNQLNQLPDNLRMLLGHQLKDSIVDCIWDGLACKTEMDFETHVNPVYGNCFTFNQNTSDGRKMKSMHLPGAEYGLTLEVLLDQQEYLRSITHSAGLRLLVHDQQSYPFPEDEGVNILPGMETSIGLRKESSLKAVVRRLPNPYPSNCVDSTDVSRVSKMDAFWQSNGTLEYSTQGCAKTCLQRTIIQYCGCGRAGWPFKGPAFDDLPDWTGQEKLCSTDWEKMVCVRAAEHFYNDKSLCECPSSCLDTSFFPVISQSMWPSESYVAEFLNKLNRSSRFDLEQLMPGPDADNFIHGPPWQKLKFNFVKLHVYYQDLSFQEISEKPSYSVPMLLGDMGGQVGLWLGLSVLTLFEVVELVFDLIHLGIAARNQKNPNKFTDRLTKVAVVERL